MNAISPLSTETGIPPRPVVVHRDECVNVAFPGLGTVSVTGPRRAELSCMVAALPKVLRQLATVLSMLEERDGTAAPHVIGLAEALEEAGINMHASLEVEPMTVVTPADPAERFALMLSTTAAKLEELATDRAHFRAPRALKDGLLDLSASIRAALRENGHGAGTIAEEGAAA